MVCDLSDPSCVQRAAADIVALHLPLAGLLNNAGVMQTRATKNALGWDMSYATNHLGPFALTEALAPHLSAGANVLFVASAVENPEHKPATTFGFRGGRYLSAEASARAASGFRVARSNQARTRTPPPSKRRSPPRWRLPVSSRGCTSTPSSRA